MTIGALTLPLATSSLNRARRAPLAVAQPADARRQPLEGTFSSARRIQRSSAGRGLVEHRLVGGADVGRIPRQRHPAERPLALAEPPHVGRHEAG